MSPLEQLLVVQEHDSAAEDLRHRRATLPEREVLAPGRGRGRRAVDPQLADARSRRDEVVREVKRLDDESVGGDGPGQGGREDDVLGLDQLAPRAPGDAGGRRAAEPAPAVRSTTASSTLMESQELLDAEVGGIEKRVAELQAVGRHGPRRARRAGSRDRRASSPTELEAAGRRGRRRPGRPARALRAGPAELTTAPARPGSSATPARAAGSRSRRPRSTASTGPAPTGPCSTATTAAPSSSPRRDRRDGRSCSATAARGGTRVRRRSARWCSTGRSTRPRCSRRVSECIGIATNNVAEYQALIAGLEAARDRSAPRRVVVRADSELLIRQLEGRYRVKSAHLQPLYERGARPARGVRRGRPRARPARGQRRRRRAGERRARRGGVLRTDPMLLWYIGPSIVAVHDIFRSRGLDYRLIGLGALAAAAHRPRRSATSRTATRSSSRSRCSALVMLATIGRSRLLRRRLICLPIGWMCGLVLSGAFLHDVSFLWPLLGSDFPDDSLFPPVTILVLLDAAGLAITVWAWGRFGLSDRDDARRLPPPRPAAGAGRVILFVRHGETEANRQRLALGRADPPLTEHGTAQAAALARAARGRAASRSCARARCSGPATTAAPIAAALGRRGRGRRPAGRARLRRVGQRRASRTCRRTSSPGGAPTRRSRRPGGESLRAVTGARRGLLHRAARRARTSVAVSHVSPIKAAVTWALGAGEELGLADVPRPRVDHPHRRPRRHAEPRRLQRRRPPPLTRGASTCARSGGGHRDRRAARREVVRARWRR